MNPSKTHDGLRSLVPLISLPLLLAAPPMQSADWPQWRGPNRDGHSPDTGLLASWPEGGPKLLWKAEGLGGGYSTPSVAGGKVFGMGYRGDDETVWALDEKTGRESWSTVTSPAFRKMGYEHGPRSTPTVDGNRLYALGAGGNLMCLDAATGRLMWKREFKEEFGGRMMSGWGFSESVLVDGNNVIGTPGATKGTVLALNKTTGDVAWQSTGLGDKAAYASILPIEYGGARQYVVFTDESVAGLAAADGRLLWKAPRKGRTAVVPTPIFDNGSIYVSSGYGVGCNLFKLSATGGTFSIEEVYANEEMVNHHGGVVRVGDHVYGYSDRSGWVCQEWLTGKKVWSERGVGKGSLSVADGHLYLRAEGRAGTVALIEATPDGYREKGRFDQPDRSRNESWPHPVIANGRLYLRDQGVLLCHDVRGN